MFFLKSLLFPIFSPSFYKEAVDRGLKKAVAFFILFTIITTIGYSVINTVKIGSKVLNAEQYFQNFPSIEVRDGELTFDRPQPFEMVTDDNIYVGVDTTGILTEIPANNAQGFLFGKYSILFKTTEYPETQEITYTELLTSLEVDEIILNTEVLTEFAQQFGVIFLITLPVITFFWKLFTGIISIILFSLIGFVILSIAKHNNAFRKSFILTVYAAVPYTYILLIGYLLSSLIQSLSGVSQIGSGCCLFAIVWKLTRIGIFWTIGFIGIKDTK